MRREAVAAAALALCLTTPSRATFEDVAPTPRALALGGAMTAVTDDAAAVFANPAAIGALRSPQLQTAFVRAHDAPAGRVDDSIVDGVAVAPVRGESAQFTLGLSGLYNHALNLASERTVGATLATNELIDGELGRLDLGLTVKNQKASWDAGGRSPARPDADLGFLYRRGDHFAAGLSLINAARPQVSQPTGQQDRAPLTARFGVSETLNGFVLAADAVKRERTAESSGAASLGAGFERWWTASTGAAFAARAGVSLGDRDKAATWGAGWRVLGGQVDYAMTLPLQGSVRVGHSVAVVLRFGVSNPEAEYERVLATELAYRKQLAASLEAGEIKQWKLSEELRQLRDEMDVLRRQLVEKTTSEAEARKRLGELERRHRDAADRYEKLQGERKRLSERGQQALLDDDWSSYTKLKLGGAPDSVLIDQVRRILLQYKDKGVDLSQANQELVRLLKSR